MLELQAGLGFRISKFRNIFVFKTKAAMDSFINSGWQFGGQATAGGVERLAALATARSEN
jgi:lipid-binding SYLF domain-containing protein